MKEQLKLEDFRVHLEVDPDKLAKKKRVHEETYHFVKMLTDTCPNVRARDRALQAIMDARMFADAAIEIGHTVLTLDVLMQLFAPTEARDTLVKRCWLNATNFADLRKYNDQKMEISTKRAEILQGIVGHIWNAQIRISRKIPVSHIVVIGEDEDDRDLASDWLPEPRRLVRF